MILVLRGLKMKDSEVKWLMWFQCFVDGSILVVICSENSQTDVRYDNEFKCVGYTVEQNSCSAVGC